MEVKAESGEKLTSVKLLQFRKEYLPIVITLAGILTDIKPVKEKALFPMEVKAESGEKETSVKMLQ
jgi:hypothetical protein